MPELSLEKSAGDETLTLLSGEERTAPPGDAILKDADGLLTCVIQGQDKRTLLGSKSRNAAYFVYGPPGVSDQQLFDALDILSAHLRAWYGASVHIDTVEIG